MKPPLPVLLALAALAVACGGDSGGQLSEAAQRGKRVYENVCIACHNGNPHLDGSVGPAIAGSSLELLRARVVEGKYPPGYTQKRPGQAMPAFPFLADQIGDLYAYLSEVAPP